MLRQFLFNGTDGVGVTVANCLAEDGAAAASVVPGTGGTCTYSSTFVHQGSTSVLMDPGTTNQLIRLPFVAANNAGAISLYHGATTLPPVFTDVIGVRHSGGPLFRVGISTAGAVSVRTTAPATIVTTPDGAWVANRQNRIEVLFDNSGGTSAGTVTLAVYNGDSLTPDSTVSSITANLGTATAGFMDIGSPNITVSTWNHSFDSVQMNNGAVTLIGPYPPAVAEERDAVFTGSGTLTFEAVAAVSAALSGSGHLAAPSAAGVSADLSGMGALTAPVGAAVPAVGTGAGTLSASAGAAVVADSEGIGVLAADVATADTVSLTGSGELSADSVQAATVGSFAGAGILSATVFQIEARSANFSGAGVLTVEEVTEEPGGSDSMSLLEARQTLADAMNALPAVSPGKPVKATPRPVKGNLRPGDAWVVVNTTSPADYLKTYQVTMNAYVILGSDERLADELVDEFTIPLIDIAIKAGGFNVSVNPQAIIAGEPAFPGQIFALALTLTVELSS